MLCTGASLAVISSICLLFVGDGCLSWIKDSLFGKATAGYDPVGLDQSDNRHDPLHTQTQTLTLNPNPNPNPEP